jgi:hypothetical protein
MEKGLKKRGGLVRKGGVGLNTKVLAYFGRFVYLCASFLKVVYGKALRGNKKISTATHCHSSR